MNGPYIPFASCGLGSYLIPFPEIDSNSRLILHPEDGDERSFEIPINILINRRCISEYVNILTAAKYLKSYVNLYLFFIYLMSNSLT
jgi:hypothetical protein